MKKKQAVEPARPATKEKEVKRVEIKALGIVAMKNIATSQKLNRAVLVYEDKQGGIGTAFYGCTPKLHEGAKAWAEAAFEAVTRPRASEPEKATPAETPAATETEAE